MGPVPADGAGTDAHLRMETALVLSDRARPRVAAPLLWLTRAGPLDPSELDSLWWSAVRATWEEQGLRPAFAVVTRQGWRLEPGDLRQEWRRLR